LAAGTLITNTAQTQSNGTTVVNTLPVTHVVASVPVLNITKSAIPGSGSSVGPNSTITYTIVVANSGNATANNVLITDTLPLSVNLVSGSLSNFGLVSGSNPVIGDVGPLAAGNSVTLTLVVTTSTVATDTVITNTAQVVGNTLPVQGSLPVTHVITATPPVLLPNLVINKTSVPGTGAVVEPDEYITYTITVQNTGSGVATGVVISDTLDMLNLGLESSGSTLGGVSGPNPVLVNGFSLNPGQNVVVTLVMTVTGTASGTVISNQASITSTEIVTPQVSAPPITHIISNTVVGPPNFTSIVKSAVPAGGTTVTQGDLIDYTITVINSGGPATNFVLTDTISPLATYVGGSGSANLGGVVNFTGSDFTVSLNPFPANSTLVATFQVSVTTNLTTTLSNQATIDSDQTAPQTSNIVNHPVQGIPGPSGGVFLPIIFKNYEGSYAILQWYGNEPVCDKVSDLDGVAGLSTDGRTDGVFQLGVNIGSEGPKSVSDIRLSSTQPGVEWDTIVGGGPVLGLYNGGSLLNPGGTISGVFFNSGLAWFQLWASDDAGYTRFVSNQYVYTVVVNFDDGSSLSAQTDAWGSRPAWCP